MMILFLRAMGEKTLEWAVADRTFQVSGHHGIEGYWERFFHEGSHPTRRQMSEKEAEMAFNSGTTYTLYSLRKDEKEAQNIDRNQLFAKIEQQFPGCTKRAQ